MGRPLGLAPEAVLETWAWPCEGQVWRWCSCLGCRGSGRTRYSGELAARAAAAEGYGNQYWPICSNILAWRTPSLTEKPGRPQSTELQRVGHDWSDTAHIDARLVLPLGALPSESWAWRWCNFLASGDSTSAKCAGLWTASAAGITALSVYFFKALIAGDQKVSLASLYL